MERSLVGSIVVTDFPYSGYKGSKKRPALVLGYAGESDVLLCQITSRNYHNDSNAIVLKQNDFESGGLPVEISYVRVEKIFTFEVADILKTAGVIGSEKKKEVGSRLRVLLSDYLM